MLAVIHADCFHFNPSLNGEIMRQKKKCKVNNVFALSISLSRQQQQQMHTPTRLIGVI